MLEDYEVECSYCGRRNMYSLEECPHCATPFDEDDDTEPTNECVDCGLTYDIDCFDEEGFCPNCAPTAGMEEEEPDPNEAAFDRKEFTCGDCGASYNWDCLDEEGYCPDCAPEDEGPIWTWLCRECEENPVVDRLDTCQECLDRQEAACDVCRGEKDLDDIVQGLYDQVELCDICVCGVVAERVEQNVGHCARCGEYASRVNTFAGPLCHSCNNRGEI